MESETYFRIFYTPLHKLETLQHFHFRSLNLNIKSNSKIYQKRHIHIFTLFKIRVGIRTYNMVLSKILITLSVPIRWYWSYSPWSQLDVLGEVCPQIRAGMRCCRPPAAFDWLPRLLEIGIRELWIHPRSSPLHCSVDNVSGDFPPLPYPITRPLSCPPDFICHPFSTPWPTALCPCQIFQPHIFQAPHL